MNFPSLLDQFADLTWDEGNKKSDSGKARNRKPEEGAYKPGIHFDH
jgi:hypothetical protein